MTVQIKWAVRIVPGSREVLALAGTQGVWLLLVKLVMEIILLSGQNTTNALLGVCLHVCVRLCVWGVNS